MQGDVTSCNVKFKQNFLGPSADPSTIIEFKQLVFYFLTGNGYDWHAGLIFDFGSCAIPFGPKTRSRPTDEMNDPEGCVAN